MKKIYMILALAMISVWSWATGSITVSDVNFGQVVYTGQDVDGEQVLHASWNGLSEYTQVFTEFLNAPDENKCLLEISPDFVYLGGGYDPFITEYDFTVSYLAVEPGDYSCQLRFYGSDAEDWNIEVEKVINVTLVVVDQSTGVENVKAAGKARKVVQNGQMLIIRNGEKYDVTGAKVE